MDKKRAQTLQERFGFKDSDLATPRHDAIMMWLDQNIRTISPALQSASSTWNVCAIERSKRLGFTLPAARPPAAINKTWERAIQAQSGFTIGFVDFCVEIKRVRLAVGGVVNGIVYTIDVEEDLPSDFSPLEAWRDLKIVTLAGKSEVECYEVKSVISSVGETIRQIRLYQTTLRAPYFVVSPDSRFKQVLIDQGIGFIQVPAHI